MTSLHDASGEDPPADDDPSGVRSDEWLPPSPGGAIAPPAARAYTPPRSPAYAIPPVAEPVVEPHPAPDALPARARRSRQAAWQLLVTGVALVAIAGGVVVLQGDEGGSDTDRPVFGEVAATSAGATVRSVDDDATAERALVAGDDVAAGTVVETSGEATATVDLADGGVVRLGGGARVGFVDPDADADAGEPGRSSGPTLDVGGGTVWINPGAAATVQVAGGTVETSGNPVALDCAPVCAIEAPAGGVDVVTRTGNRAAPAPGEVVSITSGHGFDVELTEGPSEWATGNAAADSADGLADDPVDDAPGIRATAVLGGTYSINLEVVSEPRGDAIPGPLRYPLGTTYTIGVVADAGNCDSSPCDVPLSGSTGGSGTAAVADGAVELSFGQQIDCYNETDTAVVGPDIGTTTVEVSLEVGEVDFEGGRWLVRTVQGEGSVAATLTDRCNPGDVLGTSTSSIEAAGSRS